MTKEELEARISIKEGELRSIIEADGEAAQARNKQLMENQQKVNHLQGAIGELKDLLGTFQDG